ncbi:MAG: hypothetical protein ACYTDU_02070 [Planctomycetota bacterium]|jgi:hypothetical protein
MIVGSQITHDGTGTTPYYSPSFPRGGEAAVFSVDVTHMGGTPTLVVTVDHKNVEDTSWSTAGTFSNISATGVATKDISSLKEELRFAFTFAAGTVQDFFHVIVPAPAWRPY